MPISRLPIISIGLPCFNEERFIHDAIRGILAQSFEDWELIIVDDGSTDRTPEILRTISDPRIRVEIDGGHRGLAARLNEIARVARGQYIARMDADDVAHPERLQRQLDYLNHHSEIDVLGTGIAIVDREDRVRWQRLFPPNAFIQPHRPALAHPTVCCKTEWARANPYNENNHRCEDYELWHSIERATVRNLAEPLYFYREFASFTLKKYLMMQAKIARLVVAGKVPGRASALTRAAISCLAYTAASGVGAADHLIARRSQALDRDQRVALQQTFDRIRDQASIQSE